ncbi:MAG: hypothetical protein QNJ18_11880 [Xenococcaceae cyanobacterium MO_167.B52]|nr:hypothetical protein [Xenococcaceae cyanobacterium MO_167.B52]
MDIKLLEKYRQSSNRALKWLTQKIQLDGSYGQNISDLACYYKSPYLFYISGNIEEANLILMTITTKFLQQNGDFKTSSNLKSENDAFEEYWAYTNGWIALAAQKMGQFDIATKAYQYLKSFFHERNGGFTTNKPYDQSHNVVDVLTTAHLGLAALYFGEIDRAKRAGNLLKKFISIQPALNNGFYLRLDNGGELITDYAKEKEIFYQVSALKPYQAYFMIGYPIAFLGKLYQASNDDSYLDCAKKYLDFALACHENIRKFHFSHKVAWGSAIIANLTQESKYIDFATSILDYFLNIQDTSGAWLKDEPPHVSFDQTAEIAIWLREVSAELIA